MIVFVILIGFILLAGVAVGLSAKIVYAIVHALVALLFRRRRPMDHYLKTSCADRMKEDLT